MNRVGTGTGDRVGDEVGDRGGNERVGKTGRLGKRALKHPNTHPEHSPLKQPSILPLRKGFMCELDAALTHQALFIPSQSPGNPSLDFGPLALSPSSTQIPTICTLADRASVAHLAFGSARDYLVGSDPSSDPGNSVQEEGGGMSGGTSNMSLSPHSAATSWPCCTKRGP